MNDQQRSSQTSSIGADTMFDSLLRSRDAGPDRRALSGLRDAEAWVELSYGELVAEVETVSAHLAALGVGPGDVVCVQLPNWTEAVVYTYALARLGAVVCPVTTIYRERELRFILDRTDCKLAVVPSSFKGFDHARMVIDMMADLPRLENVVSVGSSDVPGVISSAKLRRPPGLPVPSHEGEADDLVVLAFTSGTTGEPKGVMHSHRSMHAVVDGFVSHAGLRTRLTSLVMSPYGHLTGFTWGIVMPLRIEGDVVLLESWSPRRAVSMIRDYGVTFTMGATPFLSDLLEVAEEPQDFPEVFVCGGAPIPPAMVGQATTRFDCKVVSVWGMSEYPVGTATSVGDHPDRASTTDGNPVPGADVVVRGADGAAVEVGAEGDLLIRGAGKFIGYFKRPDLDGDTATSDGYLRTGDRARVVDADGRIRICGRTKDIIIRGGENIPVTEIENILLTHPDVRELALVPVPHPRLGETACACVVVQAPAEHAPTVQDLGELLGRHGVAKQFYPESVIEMDSLPRTPSGKIQKFVLRDRAAAHDPAPAGVVKPADQSMSSLSST